MADSRKNKEVVSRFYQDVFIRHDMTKLDTYMRDDYIQHNADCPQGKAGFVEFFDVIFKAIPDFKYTLKKIVAEDDIVMAYSATTGTRFITVQQLEEQIAILKPALTPHRAEAPRSSVTRRSDRPE